MNLHYLELKTYLNEVEHYPEVVLDANYKVFQSEVRLYGESKVINHRLHPRSPAIYKKLFEPSEIDCAVVYPLLAAGALKMREKLCTYAKDHLPGGRYWSPEGELRKVLTELKPSNDFCESILGLNDYLSTAIPNLHQMARSNLIQLKKNKTMEWLHHLPEGEQEQVIDLAVKRRKDVQKDCKDQAEQRRELRRKNMMEAHMRREGMKQKAQLEKDSLSQLHLITTIEELHEEIAAIDKKRLSAAKKAAQKRSLIQEQVKIRKKVLGQNVRIVFSHLRKQRPVNEVLEELSEIIVKNPVGFTEFVQDPASLVGRHISHKFKTADTREVTWYSGTVISYNPATKTHEISYEGEDEHCHFDILLDLLTRDLKVHA